MTCPACDEYRRNPITGALQSGCPACRARQIALSPAFHTSLTTNTITAQYKAVLWAEFGADWRKSHEHIKEIYEAHLARINRGAK